MFKPDQGMLLQTYEGVDVRRLPDGPGPKRRDVIHVRSARVNRKVVSGRPVYNSPSQLLAAKQKPAYRRRRKKSHQKHRKFPKNS